MCSKELYIILPYIKTSEPVTIRGITFKSSEIVDELEDSTKNNLKTIFDMFYLKDNYKINKMLFTHQHYKDNDEEEDIKRKLLEAQALITYLYSSPHPTSLDPFLTKEHFIMYWLEPKELNKYQFKPMEIENIINLSTDGYYPFENDDYGIPGFTGLINNENYIAVTKGSRLYPPIYSFWLNNYQDLFNDLNQFKNVPNKMPIINLMDRAENIIDSEQRVFQSLNWYNRTVSVDNSDGIALVYLSIAFESLLNLEQGAEVKKRFKESIKLLIGQSEKVDMWLDQFYTARSEIVHEGSAQILNFYSKHKVSGKDYSRQYRSLISFGRVLYRLCLQLLLYGSELSNNANIVSLLTSNKERFNQICKLLNENDEIDDMKRLESVAYHVFEIEKFRYVEEKDLDLHEIIGCLKKVLRIYLKVDHDISLEMKDLISQFTNNSFESNEVEQLESIKQMFDYVNKTMARNPASNVTYPLIKSVWYYSMFEYMRRKNA